MADPRDKYTIRCMEFGDTDCNWEGHAYSEDELLTEVERHGRESHDWKSFPEAVKKKAREIMRKKAA
ncbi:MAG: DUF1059 domain-containing protein [Terriglobales bacterium]